MLKYPILLIETSDITTLHKSLAGILNLGANLLLPHTYNDPGFDPVMTKNFLFISLNFWDHYIKIDNEITTIRKIYFKMPKFFGY